MSNTCVNTRGDPRYFGGYHASTGPRIVDPLLWLSRWVLSAIALANSGRNRWRMDEVCRHPYGICRSDCGQLAKAWRISAHQSVGLLQYDGRRVHNAACFALVNDDSLLSDRSLTRIASSRMSVRSMAYESLGFGVVCGSRPDADIARMPQRVLRGVTLVDKLSKRNSRVPTRTKVFPRAFGETTTAILIEIS
jgi:hypothetical protein